MYDLIKVHTEKHERDGETMKRIKFDYIGILLVLAKDRVYQCDQNNTENIPKIGLSHKRLPY